MDSFFTCLESERLPASLSKVGAGFFICCYCVGVENDVLKILVIVSTSFIWASRSGIRSFGVFTSSSRFLFSVAAAILRRSWFAVLVLADIFCIIIEFRL